MSEEINRDWLTEFKRHIQVYRNQPNAYRYIPELKQFMQRNPDKGIYERISTETIDAELIAYLETIDRRPSSRNLSDMQRVCKSLMAEPLERWNPWRS